MLSAPTASFNQLPGVLLCLGLNSDQKFDGGSGGGIFMGAMVTRRPGIREAFASHIGYSVKVGLSRLTSTFETDETIGQGSDPQGNILPVVDRYRIETTTNEIRLEPTVEYWISSAFPLMITLGPRIGYLASGSYTQSEQIISPAGAEFSDGTTVRNEHSGTMTEINGLQFGLNLGVAWEIPATPNLALRPTLGATLGFTSPVTGVNWKGNELRAGISILYMLEQSQSNPLDNR
jgi:hypothetical protein